jgi:23S rRNA (uracil1939-C5)-methyltransferase
MSDPPTLETAELTAGELAAGGRCFCRLADGTPLFAAGAVPGERIRVGLSRRRAGVAEGEVLEVLEASPDRVTPPCEWADRCGGCDWIHLAGPVQASAHQQIASVAARRQAGVELDELPPLTPSPLSLGYRHRIRLHVDHGGSIGYFARGTHEVVEVGTCAVAEAPVNQALQALQVATRPLGRVFGREISGVELRSGDGTVPWAVHLFTRKRKAWPSADLRAALQPLADVGAALWVGGRLLHGPVRLRYELGDGGFLLAGPLTFTQANPRANRGLVRRVVERVGEGDPGDFWDLYCGAGNFTLPLLAAGLHGAGVELSTEAVQGAREAALLQGLEEHAFHQARVDGRLAGRLPGVDPDVVLLDPPRTGARDLMPLLVKLKPGRVVYVGCDPVTQARDVGVLVQHGYTVTHWELFDLFPQTHHAEGLVVLE